MQEKKTKKTEISVNKSECNITIRLLHISGNMLNTLHDLSQSLISALSCNGVALIFIAISRQ